MRYLDRIWQEDEDIPNHESFFYHFQFVGRLNCWARLDIPSRKIFSPRLVWTVKMMAHVIN